MEIQLIFIAGFLALAGITKNINRSAQIIALLGFFALFFGVVKDFFYHIAGIHFIARYSVLLPLIAVVSFLLIRSISRKKNFSKSNLFLNTLLLLFLFTEGMLLLRYGTGTFMQRNRMVKNNIIKPDSLPPVTERPDVYFLVFDSYPGSCFLRDYLQYNNGGLDSTFVSRGFYVTNHSKSNYNRTALSIASTLNFEYLVNIPEHSKLEPRHYNQASLSIEHAAVPDVFIHQGYDIYNLSVFDLAKHPSVFKENFLVLPEEDMLLYNTLTKRLRWDILWNFSVLLHGNAEKGKQEVQLYLMNERIKIRNFNNLLIDTLPKIALQNTGKPKFIYAHFYLPHPPFFYDGNGNMLALDLVKFEQAKQQKTAFISYLEYTNKVMLKMVNTILKDSPKPPVIILESDHGYRDFKKELVSPDQYFKNYAAYYFPDGNYSMLYDTISNVNTFPVVFNKYFNTHIPMLKDTSVFLEY